jgi:hypothetical protein
MVSTWKGRDNAFYEVMRREKSTLLRTEAYWWSNPERYSGAYRMDKGRVEYIDTNYRHPDNYPFGQPFPDLTVIRSPWVDAELRRAGAASSLQLALEELYGLTVESGRKLFRDASCEIATETIRPPVTGEIVGGSAEPRFRRGHGPIKTWGDVGDGKGGPFAAGCDLGEGMGATYSTLEVIDLRTGEQVLDFADNTLSPTQFALRVVQILRWLNGRKGDEHTYLTFEQNGRQGKAFGAELLRLGYGNVARTKYATKVPRGEEDTYLGMRNKDGGLSILLELDRAIMDGEVTIRSEALASELNEFQKDDEGNPAFPRGGDGHGDRAQGFAMAWALARGRTDGKPVDTEDARREAIRNELAAAVNTSGRWGDYWKLSTGGVWV